MAFLLSFRLKLTEELAETEEEFVILRNQVSDVVLSDSRWWVILQWF